MNVGEDGMNEPNQSEVARLREQIACEYRASQRVFSGFSPTARHEYITKRQENIAGHFEELKKHMSPEEAMLLMMQIDNEAHGILSSGSIS
jgi:hypothetical protein